MAHLHHLVFRAGRHEQDLAVPADAPVDEAHEDDDAPVVVILAVKDQRLQRRLRIPGGGRDVLHDIVQNRVDVDARLGGDLRRVLGGDADDLLDLVLHPLGLGGGQVDLVDHGQDLQVVIQGQIGVGQGLGLHALAGVHHQHGPLAGGQGTADLVVEVHVSRGVDQIQGVVLPVGSGIIQPHGAGLDGDAPLSLQIHVVQDLVLHDPLLHRAALFDQTVGQGGLAVVDMGDDREISDMLLVDHDSTPSMESSAACARSTKSFSSSRKARESLTLTSPGWPERQSR